MANLTTEIGEERVELAGAGWASQHAYRCHTPSKDLIHVQLLEEGFILFDTGMVNDHWRLEYY